MDGSAQQGHDKDDAEVVHRFIEKAGGADSDKYCAVEACPFELILA